MLSRMPMRIPMSLMSIRSAPISYYRSIATNSSTATSTTSTSSSSSNKTWWWRQSTNNFVVAMMGITIGSSCLSAYMFVKFNAYYKWIADYNTICSQIENEPIDRPLDTGNERLKLLRWRSIHLKGEFVPIAPLLMADCDRVVVDSQASWISRYLGLHITTEKGYRVIAPFRCADNGDIVLIDRGWIKDKDARFGTPSGTVSISGPLLPRDNQTDDKERFGMADFDAEVLSSRFSKKIGQPVLPMIISSDASIDGILGRQSRPSDYNPNSIYVAVSFAAVSTLTTLFFKYELV